MKVAERQVKKARWGIILILSPFSPLGSIPVVTLVSQPTWFGEVGEGSISTMLAIYLIYRYADDNFGGKLINWTKLGAIQWE